MPPVEEVAAEEAGDGESPTVPMETVGLMTSLDTQTPSSFLLERSSKEFRTQVEVAYVAKMVPRRSSVHAADDIGGRSAAATYSRKDRCVEAFRRRVDETVDGFFFAYGSAVARRPVLTIFSCILVTGLCSLGLLRFRQENNVNKLWIPRDSTQRINSDWLWENYPPRFRFASMVFKSENVLTPDVIKAMYKTKRSVDSIRTVEYGDTWSTRCVKVPVVKPPDLTEILGKRRRKKRQDFFEEDNDDFFDGDLEAAFGGGGGGSNNTEVGERLRVAEYFSVAAYPDPYCSIVENMESACMEFSILELWANDGKYDETTDEAIENLTVDQILDKINNVNKSGAFLVEKNFTKLLSNVERSDGRIVGAEATVMQWFSSINFTEALRDPAEGRGEPIDRMTLAFEGEMLEALLNRTGYPDGLEAYPNVQRSFGDVAGSAILGDVASLAIGYAILGVYVQIMLGRLNCVENRAALALAGMLGVVLGLVLSFGLCSALGLFFGPLHNVLPFLLLGIGIDDMFVIVQCWDTLETKDDDDEELPERVGRAMVKAGGAITVTSVTDVIAFAIGGLTVLPALQSFCLFASVGILATFFFQCTFFVAFLAVDRRRAEASRNACLPCHKHGEGWSANRFSTMDVGRTAFKAYGRLVTKPAAKATVVTTTLVVTAVGIWGNVLLEQRFDPAWFLPPDSYLSKWLDVSRRYFPFRGEMVTIHCAGTDPRLNLRQLNQLTVDLAESDDIIDNVDSWIPEFVGYFGRNYGGGGEEELEAMDDVRFRRLLVQFLFSPKGAKYRSRFLFERPLTCGQAAPMLLMSDITFTHKFFDEPSQQILAMNKVKDLVDGMNLTTGSGGARVFPMAKSYAAWETDEVIAAELYRNIGLAIVCVFITTTLLIANVVTSLMVLVCVVLSLVDVAGFMHFWGLTIDTVSCVNLIIAIGLCVDYSAHIAHRFTTETTTTTGGDRNSRVVLTLANIGPAVLNGGISTSLAFLPLAGSASHVFMSFFKIFFLVVTFGLFHGLVLLPVILSLVGPSAAASEDSSTDIKLVKTGGRIPEF